MDGLKRLNAASMIEAIAGFDRCCGAPRWAARMADARPFADEARLFAAADTIWWALGPDDWREAFTHHPRIGDREALRTRFADTQQWAEGEQAGALTATDAVLDSLAEGNRVYEARFGFVFIVCATGKSAPEMLGLLQGRLANPPEAELRIAASEQAKITRLRLEKLLRP
jgi:2-oxo-4-hydroxy-4-carboxy-5-ureidoimidazoline decarboxylase